MLTAFPREDTCFAVASLRSRTRHLHSEPESLVFVLAQPHSQEIPCSAKEALSPKHLLTRSCRKYPGFHSPTLSLRQTSLQQHQGPLGQLTDCCCLLKPVPKAPEERDPVAFGTWGMAGLWEAGSRHPSSSLRLGSSVYGGQQLGLLEAPGSPLPSGGKGVYPESRPEVANSEPHYPPPLSQKV